MNENVNENKVQWQHLIEMLIVLVTILGSTIPLYMHTDSKFEENRKETNQLIEAIRQDIRDFHGRLCTIEERNKEKTQ
jgi:hypothetical protein